MDRFEFAMRETGKSVGQEGPSVVRLIVWELVDTPSWRDRMMGIEERIDFHRRKK